MNNTLRFYRTITWTGSLIVALAYRYCLALDRQSLSVDQAKLTGSTFRQERDTNRLLKLAKTWKKARK